MIRRQHLLHAVVVSFRESSVMRRIVRTRLTLCQVRAALRGHARPEVANRRSDLLCLVLLSVQGCPGCVRYCAGPDLILKRWAGLEGY